MRSILNARNATSSQICSLEIPMKITKLSHLPLNMWKSMPIGMIGFRPSKAQ